MFDLSAAKISLNITGTTQPQRLGKCTRGNKLEVKFSEGIIKGGMSCQATQLFSRRKLTTTGCGQ